MITFFTKIFAVVVMSIASMFGGGVSTPPPVQSLATSTQESSLPTATTSEKPVEISSEKKGSITKQSTAPSPTTNKTLQTVIQPQSAFQVVGPTLQVTASPPIPVPVTPPPNTTLCNGKYWNACPSGQDLVCPQSGSSAYCQPNAETQAAEQQATAQQHAQIEQEQQQAQQAKLQPLEDEFTRAINNVAAKCVTYGDVYPAAVCEQAESELLPILQQEAIIGISKSDALPQLQAIQGEYAKLQTAYYNIGTHGWSASLQQGYENMYASEMQILANDETMFQ